MPIKIKLGELLAKEAARRGKRSLSLKDVEAEIKDRFPQFDGISRATLAKLAKDEGEAAKGILWTTLEPLCLFFNCRPGDLIVLEGEEVLKN